MLSPTLPARKLFFCLFSFERTFTEKVQNSDDRKMSLKKHTLNIRGAGLPIGQPAGPPQ
jgi:hypothetical protein